MRRGVIIVSAAAVLALFCGYAAAGPAAPSYFEADREFFPYYPSLIKWNKSSAGFIEPEQCAACHPRQYEEWTGSVHALAFKDPVYQGELSLAMTAAGHAVSRQCEGCHSPAGMVTGEIKGAGLAGLSRMATAGVSCDICHSISGVTHWQTPAREPENGSMVLTPGIDTTSGVKLVKRGPYPPSEGCGMGFHECVESPLHLRAELCASCHQVFHYDAHFPFEATYAEWKRSPYAQKGILCQDCHMTDTETFLRASERFERPGRTEYRHYFVAANYLVYFLAEQAARKAGDEALAANVRSKYEMAVARLKAAAAIELSPVYRDGRLAELKVRVRNERAGHNLPTSLTNVREMWLEVTVRDAKGAVLMTSGAIDKEGRLAPETRVFNSEGMGKDFHFAVDPWVVTAFSRHDTIPPHGYRDVYYGLPAFKDGTISVEVRLRYRQADQKLANKLLGAVPRDIDLAAVYGLTAVPPLPVVDMVVKKADLKTRQ